MARGISKELKYIQLAVLVIASILYLGLRCLPVSGPKPAKEDFFYISRVVDGDTVKLSNGQKMRLIGVDTPEVHYSNKLLKDSDRTGRDIKTIQALGRKASDFTKNLCLGKKARLEFDVEKHDRYGRLLGYLYLEDGTFVNGKILEEGYGQVMTVPPNVKHAEYFLKLQKDARAKRKGLWSITDNL